MSRHVVSCRAEDELPHVEGLMARNRKSRIVVLDGAGRPVGVVSLSDIARHDQLFAAETMRQVSSREVLSARAFETIESKVFSTLRPSQELHEDAEFSQAGNRLRRLCRTWVR